MILTWPGYQSILPIVLDKKINLFSSLCRTNEALPCNAQKLRLDMMFNITVSLHNIMCLLWGLLSLKYGARLCIIIGGTLLTTSSFIFGLDYDWPCFIGYIGMGIGSGGVFFGLMGIPGEYPRIQGLLFSLLMGASDSSTAIPYIFLILFLLDYTCYVVFFK